MLYGHFIARAQADVEGVPFRTLLGPLVFVRSPDLVAAAREQPLARSTPELMLEYNAALAAASQRFTVIPLRFGTRFGSEAAITRLLAERRVELLAALDRLDGKAEMGLRARLPAGAEAAAEAARWDEVCRPIESRFEVRETPSGERFLELTHLIERQDAGRRRREFEMRGVEVSGPRPPFHFLPRFLRLPVRVESRSGRGSRPRAAAAGA